MVYLNSGPARGAFIVSNTQVAVLAARAARRESSSRPQALETLQAPYKTEGAPGGAATVRTASSAYPAPAHGRITNADEYVARAGQSECFFPRKRASLSRDDGFTKRSSLRDRDLTVYLFGKTVPEFVDHPIIKPSINAVAETRGAPAFPQFSRE